MSQDIIIPSLGESINEVVISCLLVDTGNFVQENQGILEVESEKVNQVIYSPSSGIIYWKIKVGDTVSVGDIVGCIRAEQENNFSSEDNLKETNKLLSNNKKSDCQLELDKKNQKEIYRGEIIEFPGSVNLGSNKTFTQLEHPLSHKSIKQEIFTSNLKEISREERKPMSSLRKTISKRLVQSLRESAMLTTFNEINMNKVLTLRKEYKEHFFERTQIRLGFMSFFIFAVTQALKYFPILNSYINGDDIVYRKYYNIGVAVATDRGLIVPVIKDCDKFSLIELENKLAFFSKKAREGSLSIEDLSEGGFTITNAGVFGSLFSTPIINPPQVGILGMHKVEKRPIVIDNEIRIADMMYVALSYDHRIVDGKDAVSFLMKIKEIIENPENINIT